MDELDVEDLERMPEIQLLKGYGWENTNRRLNLVHDQVDWVAAH
jgi:hypothetical protein